MKTKHSEQPDHPGILVLADGTVFEGISVGDRGTVCGEVVFNTAQIGYQEVLTDPSYAQQLIVFTQPHIGNVGINHVDMESRQIFAKGVIMRSMSSMTNHWQAKESLEAFLKKQAIIGLSDIDTRALTHHLRQFGSQSGCISSGDDINIVLAHQLAKNFTGLSDSDLTQQVTIKNSYTLETKETKTENATPIVVIDFGVKQSILDALLKLNTVITVVPATTTVENILALSPKGIVLSNGPGDPAACLAAIENIKILLKTGIPIMGICLGHQLLGIASGAKTTKMTVGHHGANHPIQCLETKKVFVSSQNHGFVIAESPLPNSLEITHRSLFDHTIAGIKRTDVPAFGFQGHPEAGPGPLDLTYLFKQLLSMIKTIKTEVNNAKKNRY